MSKKRDALKLALDALEKAEHASRLIDHLGAKLGMTASDLQLDKQTHFARAITAIREALAEQPAPPPECKTDAEKTAFAFGWWKALEENRKQPAQQEPVAWVCEASSSDEKHAIDYWPGDVDDLPIGTKLYTSPPASKPWVGLTEQERKRAIQFNNAHEALAVVIEAKLKEKNA